MSFPGRVFVASGDRKSGRMSFVQAQRECFEEDGQAAEEERLARQLKEENDSRVDAILEAELKRRQENQDRAEEPPGRFEDQRLKALQRLHSMEWKRNQQDHVKIAREQAVRYEEVKSRRAAEEVFFEGTRQAKTKTRKFRKDEVIHSFDEITPKLPQMQQRKAAPALPGKVPQPRPPPSNAWQHKRGSELFGSAPVPSSAEEEEETALRKALAASMESFYAEQKNAELAITRSVSIGRKCSEEKRDTTFCKSEMPWLAAENETDTFARKSEFLPNREEYCEMPQNNYLVNGLSKNTNILPTPVRNSGVYCEPVSAAGKQVHREELELRGGSPQNCQLVSQSPVCEELESSEESEEEWEGDKDEVFQESNVPSYCPKFQNVTRTPEPTFSEPVASQTVGHETSQKMFHPFPRVPEKNRDGPMCSRVRKDVDGQLESPPGRANYKDLIASSAAELPLTRINSEPEKNLTHTVSTSSAPLSCSRTCSLSSDLDEKPKDNSCKKTEESPVDPSCFLKFEKIPNAKSVDSETTSMATAVSSSSVDSLFASGVPTPQPAVEPHQSPVFSYQDQNIAAMSELGDTLSALKLQTQGYPATSIPRQPQPYNLVPGTIPGFTPDMCMALLGMYGPMWPQALGLGMFPVGPMMDPRVQAAQLGLYSGNPLEAGTGGPVRTPMMQEAVAPDIPRAALPQQFLQPGMFMHPSMYPGPRPGAHMHAAQQSAMPHLASLRPPLVNPMPFLDPQLANLSRPTDQGSSQSMPAKSAVHQDQPPAFLCAASSGGKGAYPSMEPMMPPPGMVYSHPQGFLNQPVGEQLPFPFGLPQVPPPVNPAPVPFRPKPEPDVGRGRGRLRH
ncbi:uncharacterized protein LOC134533050 isoform X2 [Bacillus rossius redtenbacheri]|uniref:uncharacterized protein LOC134533050 isoform X2 n=1 Tax=Bacillus rossius redtenbacheri TaxID=93214 RepID=UPI002FDD5EFB